MTNATQIVIKDVDAHAASMALFDPEQGFAGHNQAAINGIYRQTLTSLGLSGPDARSDTNADRVYAHYMGLYKAAKNYADKNVIVDAMAQFRYERLIKSHQDSGESTFYVPEVYGLYPATGIVGLSEPQVRPGFAGQAFTVARDASERIRVAGLNPMDKALEDAVSNPAQRTRVKALLTQVEGMDAIHAEVFFRNKENEGNRNLFGIFDNRDDDARLARRVYNTLYTPAPETGPVSEAAPAGAGGAATTPEGVPASPASGPAEGGMVLGYPAIDPQVQLDLETLGLSTGGKNTRKFGAGATDMDGARGPATQSSIANFKAAHPNLADKNDADVFAAIRKAAEAARAHDPLVEARSIVTALGNVNNGMLKDGLDASEKGTLHTRLAELAGHLNTNAQGDLQTVIRSIVTAVTPAIVAGDTQLQADLTTLKAKAGIEPQRQ